MTGYGAGGYNQITGYYEVRASDAHCWAEVYFSDFGWVPFDPTPGWTPQHYPTSVQQWFLSPGAAWALDLPLAEVAGAPLTGLGGAAPVVIPLLTIAGVLLV